MGTIPPSTRRSASSDLTASVVSLQGLTGGLPSRVSQHAEKQIADFVDPFQLHFGVCCSNSHAEVCEFVGVRR